MTSQPDLDTVLAKLERAEVQFRRLSPSALHELPSPVVNGVELLLSAMEEYRTFRVQAEATTANEPGGGTA